MATLTLVRHGGTSCPSESSFKVPLALTPLFASADPQLKPSCLLSGFPMQTPGLGL